MELCLLEPAQNAAGLYRQLAGSDIRLVKILPEDVSTEIQCDLEQLPLAMTPGYYALSYVWGDVQKRRQISVNGERVDVTENLYDALYYLRQHYVRRDIPQFFWIDALCINQMDNDEKSQQVTRMADVYSTSHQVIIWLGTSSGPEDQYLGELFRMASENSLDRRSHDEGTFQPPFRSEEGAQDAKAVFCDRDEGEMFERIIPLTLILALKPWFQRIWTVQEACLGIRDPIIWAGHHCVSMQDLVGLLVELLSSNPRGVAPCAKVISLGMTRLHLQRCSGPFLGHDRAELRKHSTSIAQLFVDLLCILEGYKATNPLDRLYGLLGLIGSFHRELPKQLWPDYAIEGPSLVYWRYATYLLNETEDLRLLCFDKSELEGVPSWVTDFRYLRGGGLICLTSSRASGRVSVSADGLILSVQGLIIGTCDNRIQPCERDDLFLLNPGSSRVSTLTCLARVQRFEKEILDWSASIRQRPTEATLETWLSFLCLNISRPAYHKLIGYLKPETSSKPEMSSPSGYRMTVSEFQLIDRFSYGWFVLDDGTIGTTTESDVRTEKGDLICVFEGARVPIIVRKAGLRYQLVGPATLTDGPYGPGSQFDEGFWSGRDRKTFELV